MCRPTPVATTLGQEDKRKKPHPKLLLLDLSHHHLSKVAQEVAALRIKLPGLLVNDTPARGGGEGGQAQCISSKLAPDAERLVKASQGGPQKACSSALCTSAVCRPCRGPGSA